MSIPFIDLKSQYLAYREEIDAVIAKVMESAQFIMGPEVQALEGELAHYCGIQHAIGCSSGTMAIELALRALGIGIGDEVITSPFTFFATAEMISIVGATPVFVDISAEDYTIDPSKIEAAITPKTRAIMPVSLYGQMAPMREIEAIARAHGLVVIEDAAQSFGATQHGVKSCGASVLATTSFFPAKPLGCAGDGGAVFTSDDSLAGLMRSLLNHGQGERYKHDYVGTNGRLDAIQAAILRVKLRHFDDEVAARQKIAARYDEALAGYVTIPKIMPGNTSVYAQYSVRVKNRDTVVNKLQESGVPTAIHYPIPLYAQKVYASMKIDPAHFPVSEAASREILSLPFSPFLKESDQECVIDALKKAVA